ncbi:MAG: molybdate ABC transporter substrate-binding protein [Denitrovibrio sp.]|nr:MAG: molybdate ABC transporter substrate-binding protein [Denitrovibrio sp.]
MKKLLLFLSMLTVMTAYAEKITIYSAASTTNAVKEISEMYTQKTGVTIVPSFASSGTLAKQISNSAPADIYIAANQKWMDWLKENDFIEKGTDKHLLANRLALVASKSSNVHTQKLDNATAVKLINSAKRLAIADPAHAPAGKYAQKTLESLGVWADIQSKTARVQTVRVALAMVERDAVPLGIIYSSDAALSEKVKVVGLFDEELHGSIRYQYAIVKGKETKLVRDFYNFLISDAAIDIYNKYGFIKAE